MQPPSPPLIKINLLKNNNIYAVFIFCNCSSASASASDADLATIFNDDELAFINKHKIKIHFIDAKIYPDDTIMTVKIKILEALANVDYTIECMYLFGRKQIELNLGNIYNTLTQNGKIKMSPSMLQTFLSNLYAPSATMLPLPEHSITLVDFITICNKIQQTNTADADNAITDIITLTVNCLLGQQEWITDLTQLVAYNPFTIDTNEHENITRLQKVHNNLFYLPTNNNNLLMDTGNIYNNTLYLCLANDVLPYAITNAATVEISNNLQKDIIKAYYPLLWDAKIFNNNTLLQNVPTLKGSTANMLKDDTLHKYFNVINMFYGVYQQQTTQLKYKQRGIQSLHLCIHPQFHFKLSLDTLFKTLHATKTHPLIKYNPAMRQENIYRIYADKLSTDGRKIPYLKKTTLLRIIKEIGNTPKTVTVYIEYIIDSQTFIITCEINENGKIFIHFTPSANYDPLYFSIEQMDEILANTINPVLENIKDYFEQNGYKLSLFKSITEQNVEIIQLTYNTAVQSTATFDFGTFKNCITPIFNNETSLFKNTDVINLRFKRVSNFNKTTSQEAFILDKIKDGHTVHDIAALLMENFKDDLTFEAAINMVTHVFGEQQMRKIAGRRTIITDNPGFHMTIQYNNSHDTIILSMTNINNIQYLHTIPIYIDTLLRLATTKKLGTNYPTTLIDKCCNIKTKVATIPDIVPANDVFIPQIAQENIKTLMEQYADVVDAADVAEINEEIDEENQRKLQELMAMYGDDDEDDEDDDENQEGGAKKTDESDDDDDSDNDDDEVVNVEKIKLKRMFQNRMKKRDPMLFINSGKNYSRECQSSSKRQPIALTNDELKKIQKQYPNFLRPEDIISYGSDSKHKINYICPRYWCLKTNMPIDSSEMKEVVGPDGKKELVHPTCGRIIPNKAKGVTPGHYVYEFYGPNDNQYPGLIPGKNKGDSCLPCCFTKWNTDSRLNALKKCLPSATTTTAAAATTTPAAAATTADDAGINQPDNVFYIKGPEKVPLPLGRWGHLPMQLQFFFREMNIDCQVSKLNPIVKQNHPCLMRHGVESDPQQSFLACMSNILYYGLGNIKTIAEIKAHIIKSITLDDFITFQNGDLVTNFAHSTSAVTESTAAIPEKYKKTKIYQASIPFLTGTNTVAKHSTLFYLHKIISAFEHFADFLNDDNIIIDHTYLWDIFAQPNNALFPKGLNIVIFDILNNDITNNIQMVCPTNHYAGEPYDPRKPTCFIVKQYDYYEPIYNYTKLAEGKIQINKIFFERDKNITPAIKLILNNIVKPFIGTVCKPLPSMPNIYHTKTAPLLNDLLKALETCNVTPTTLVANFNNKIIGVIGRHKGKGTGHEVYIPCYPSMTTTTIPITFMTDLDLWKPYDITVSFLNELAATAKTHRVNIPCAPAFQVMEDSLIVGILTETNQFIQISQPVAPNKVKIPLPQLKNGNYMLGKHNQVDSLIAAAGIDPNATTATDYARVDYVNRLKKDTAFYNIFRNTIKILMNSYENNAPQIKLDIIKTIDDPLTLYNEKMATITALLNNLIGTHIQFIGDDKYYKTVDKVATCVTFNNDKCKSNKICALSSDNNGKCNLILPIKNLTTGKKNKEAYYARFVDELIRYNHIRKYIMEPYNLYSFGNKVTYNLSDQEILLMQSLITPEYFDGLIPAVTNKYVQHISYDQIEPIIHQPYDNAVNLTDESYQMSAASIADIAKVLSKCNIGKPTKISNKWVRGFNTQVGDKVVEVGYTCGIQLITYLIQTTNITLSPTEIKKQLAALYVAHGGYNFVMSVLNNHLAAANRVATTAIDENIIFMSNYQFNVIDLWLLIDKFKLPTILIFTSGAANSDKVMVGYKDDSTQYCIIWVESKTFKLASFADHPTNPLLPIDTAFFNEAFTQFQSITTLIHAAKQIVAPAKPKGRPRKRIAVTPSPSPITPDKVEAAPIAPANNNNNNNDTIDTIEHVEILAPIRKRGRPRKRIIIGDNSSDDYEIGIPVLKTNKDKH